MSRIWIRRTLAGLGILLLTIVAACGAVIAFDAPPPIPRLLAGDSMPGISSWNTAEVPQVLSVKARDGAPLTYRLYAGAKDRVVVLVHGSSGTGFTMHKVAQALQAAGATVYSISLRGHGGSGTTNGDTSYIGQLDDDLADFVQAVGIVGTGSHRSLVGFSSGGGFVLREASGRNSTLFDSYVAVSPFIAHDSPTTRGGDGGWASVAVPRAVALSVLNGIGLPWFQGLPVVRFATNAKPDQNRTPVYSFRLLVGMHLDRNWRGEIAHIDRPTAILVGARDELFFADRFQPLFAELNPRIAVTVQPDAGHMNMIADPAPIALIVATWKRLNGIDQRAERFDFKVREDFFAGLDGDRESFDRAMKEIADTLSAKPDHAQALVWRGDGRLFLAGQAFQKGDIAQGRALSAQGLADMARAVALDPQNVAVRVPRATGLLPYAQGLRPFDRAEADRLTALAMEDFEFVVTASGSTWSGMAEHNRGELLGALASGWLQLGDMAKANAYLDRMVAELPGTPYAKAAELRRAQPSAKASLTCLGCH